MSIPFSLHKIEEFLVNDPKLLFTVTCYILIFTIYINLNVFKSPAVGILAFILYFSINGIFLAHAFFEKEDLFFRLTFGLLLLIMLLGFVGWLVLIIYNLDTPEFTLVLFIVATLSSLSKKRTKNQNAN